MRWSEIPRNPPRSTLGWFAVFWTIFMAGLGAWLLARDNWIIGAILTGLAVFPGIVGMLFPPLMRPVYVGAMMVTFPLNWVVSHLILFAVYYCIFTPLGLFFRLIGRDVLAFRGPSEKDTYWVEKPAARDIRSYFRQS